MAGLMGSFVAMAGREERIMTAANNDLEKKWDADIMAKYNFDKDSFIAELQWIIS